MTEQQGNKGRLEVRAGFHTATGRRAANEDYVAFQLAGNDGRSRTSQVFAIADGMGGHKGGRVAAELTVTSFLDGYFDRDELGGVQKNAAQSLEAINRWIHAIGRSDANLSGMGCTFTALILQGRRAHMVHVGDTRLYRLRDGRLTQLSIDHVPQSPAMKHLLMRAVGIEDDLRIDYTVEPLRAHDRYLLVSDGVHGGLSDAFLAAELKRQNAPGDAAARLVEAALNTRVGDNATALVVDVLSLPFPNQLDLEIMAAAQPIMPPPMAGAVLDGLVLERIISDGRYSRVFRAKVTLSGADVVVKFPKPVVGADRLLRQAFLREAWIAARVDSPWIGEVIEIPPDRRSCMYTVMPYYEGETLERRLHRDPPLSLSAGLTVAVRLSNAAATLHRAGIIHRDIKPDNVILEKNGGLKLLDLGIARLPRLEDQLGMEPRPGTPSYMAPELFDGGPSDEATDLYALGVTIYRLFSRHFPYGEIEPFSHPRFGNPTPLARYRPDLPAWLDQVLARAVSAEPSRRYQDVIEFIFALEHGAERNVALPSWQPLYHRNPLLFWKIVSALLLVLLLFVVGRHGF